MDPQTFANLVAYSAQVACVTGLAGGIAWMLRVDGARVRYSYWRAVLLFCLALPWLQGRGPAAGPEADGDVATSIALRTTVAGEPALAAASDGGGWWLALTGALLVGGITLRVLSLAIAVIRLGRLRRAGVPAPPGLAHGDLQRRLGTCAEIRFVPAIAQPVTFGVRQPVVLLPEALRAQEPEVQRAVLCHELLHVRRRDWLWLGLEELVRAALWFHPAVWWLVSRIQLAREEMVDQMVVRMTGKRRAYIRALLAFANGVPEPAATAFARRNHLFRRIVLVSREGAMSAPRMMASCAVMALVVTGGGWYVTGVFPLVQPLAAQALLTPGPLEREARPITPENPIPRRVFAAAAFYPPAALAHEARASVTLRIVVDARGGVAEVRQLQVSVVGADAAMVRAAQLEDAFVAAAVTAVRQWQYEPPVEAPLALDVRFEFVPGMAEARTNQGATGSLAVSAPARAAGVEPPYSAQALRVGGDIPEPRKTRQVAPVYPAIAQQARVSGIVILEALIGPDGRVAHARVLRGVPLLEQAALDAVMQWEFTPTLLNGAPIPIRMTVTVNFTLAPPPASAPSPA